MIIFVYGSLKQNRYLHSYLKNAKFLGYAVTCRRYPLILNKTKEYPYLLNQKGGKSIKGELYKIDYNLLKKLDRLEEVPHYYQRKRVCVKKGYKSMVAYAYFSVKKRKFLQKELLEEF